MANNEENIHYTKIDTISDSPEPIFDATVPQNTEVLINEKIENKNSAFETTGQPELVADEIPSDTLSDKKELVDDQDMHPREVTSSYDAPENHFKLYIILGLIFFVVVAGIVFLFNKIRNNARPKNVTLTYWGLWEEKEVMEPLISKFQKNNPTVTIEYIKQNPIKYREKVVTQVKDGRGPDLFRFHNTWLPMLTDTVAQIPKKIMTNDEFESRFYKIAQDDLKVKTSYYGIPLTIDNLILIYNDDFLKRLGITSPPETWDDVINYAKQLTVQDTDNEIVTSGIALGTADNKI